MRCGTRAFLPLVIGTLVGAVLTGCGGNDDEPAPPPPATSTPAPASTTPPNLDNYYSQQPQWGSCEDFAAEGPPLSSDLDCTHITVPIDYDRPDGDTARIAVSRSRATGTKIGSLLTNPGGPGVSGLGLASQAEGTKLQERFDVIGFDPRGVGASTPAVECQTPQEADEQRKDPDTDMSPAGIAQTEQENKVYVDRCVQRSGAELLEHIGTREVARDMDVIRAALGDETLSFLGYSYGTRIGSAYAEQFPDRVRAMVLDGAVDPEENPIQSMVDQGAGFQKAFDTYAADCVKAANCPLGPDPTRAVAEFRALVGPLEQQPAPTTDPRGLGYGDAITGVQQALYTPELWRLLTVGLRELRSGHGDTLLHLADLYEGRRDDGTYANVNDAFNAVRCVDDPPITDRAAVGQADAAFRKAVPFLDDGRGTGQAPLDLCAIWPVPNTSAPHRITVSGLPKLVVVSTTGDPATPYQAGVDLARQLDASLITYKGDQHTVVLAFGVGCVDDAVVEYFIDLRPPAPDLTC